MKALSIALVVTCAGTAWAQTPPLKGPDASPAASVLQTIGLTEVRVDYARPAVNKRPVWGKLVPYDEVWRAGANQNTTVTFSTDVKVNGKPLRAGTYGLHMIPTAKSWTVIFSNMSVAWGSFSYDQKEDALRVTATPLVEQPMEERLSYRFDNPSNAGATLVLRWEKLALPITIEVDTPKVVMASMRAELRGIPRFFWQGWNQAAGYWLRNGGSLDEALAMADKSVAINATFQNLTTKAAILEKQGKTAAAKEVRAQAMPLATEADRNQMGYQLIAEQKIDAAIELFRQNVQLYPGSWNVHDSLGEALAIKGDRAGAIAAYEKALSLVKDPVQKKRIETTLAGLRPGS